jgi:hypothetical protein
MAKQRKAWMPGPATKATSSLPGTVKDEVDTKARELIETVLKRKHMQPPPEGSQLNSIVDITIKWLGSKCFLLSIYRTPSGETFEPKFARMDYVGNARFNLAFMRHTGQWVELYAGQTVDECMKAIKDDPWFVP